MITPDAYFDCDRVGVPYAIALNLTVPETVNSTNHATMLDRVRRGASDVRGAATVVGVDGCVTHLANCRREEDR